MTVALVLVIRKWRVVIMMQSSYSRLGQLSSTYSLKLVRHIVNQGSHRNVIIGADQAEGVHCLGPFNLYNVWFEDVCEDAVTLKQTSGTSNIIGGGAKRASDTVVQHNGGGKCLLGIVGGDKPYSLRQGVSRSAITAFLLLQRSTAHVPTARREYPIEAHIPCRYKRTLQSV